METIDVHFNALSSDKYGAFPNYKVVLEELIELLRVKGPLTDRLYESLMNARSAAGDWDLCACGNLCKAIPRRGKRSILDEIGMGAGTPQDELLVELGMEFYDNMCKVAYFVGRLKHQDFVELKEELVMSKCLEFAQASLDAHLKIEKRASEILAEMFPTEEKWAEYVKSIETPKP